MRTLVHTARTLVALGLSVLAAACSGGEESSSVAPNPGPGAGTRFTVTVTPQLDTVDVGLSTLLGARVVDGAGAPQSGVVDWSSLDPSVATVSGGTVTTLSAGTARIVARYGSAADTATVVVQAVPLTLQVTPSAVALSLGDTIGFNATLVGASSASFSAADVEWSASDTTVASMVADGVITANAVGELTVTARVGNMSSSAAINILPLAVGSVAVTPTAANTSMGTDIDLNATVRDGSGRVMRWAPVTWTSSDPKVATVSASGKVHPLKQGGVVITARSSGRSGTATVNIAGRPAKSVKLSLANDTVVVGATQKATATAYNGEGDPIKGRTIAYQSSNPAVATVNSSGVVTAMIAGSTTISAICDGLTSSEKLVVQTATVTTVAIVPASPSAQAGSQATLVADVRDQTGQPIANPTVTWSSSSPFVATINAQGVVTANAVGTSTITAVSGGVTATTTLTVTAQPVASVSVTPSTGSVELGQTLALAATASGSSGQPIGGAAFTWSSSNPSVATVSALGVVTPVAVGTATITATSGGQSGSAQVTVTPPPPVPVASISVSLNSGTVDIGQSAQAVATLYDASGNVLTGRQIDWGTTDSSLATVTSAGLVTAAGAGTVTVVATSEGVSGFATLTVTAPPPAPVASITVTAPSTSLNVGQTSQLTVTLYDAQGNVLTGRTIAYSSSSATVASVSTSGLVTAVGGGSAVVTVTSGAVSNTLGFTVAKPPALPVPTTVTVSANPTSLAVGQTTQATAVVKDQYGAPMAGQTVTWTTSKASVATVSSGGLVTAAGAGTATISASTSGKTGSVTITVTNPTPVVTSISVSLAASVDVGQTTQATATALDQNGNAMSGVTFTWSSSSAGIASVSSAGVVSGVAVGSATIKATASGVNGTASITVTKPPVQGPAALPKAPALLSFTFPKVTGKQWYVASGQSLQQALNSAQRGDEVVLQAGATFTGNFTLPAKPGTAANGWIIVRSDKLSQLPPQGTRVTSAKANLMPKIVTNAVAPALATALSASGWWIAGVEISIDPALTAQNYGIVTLGDGSQKQNSLSLVATDLVLDRVYVHGAPQSKSSRCIALNSARTQISDSYVSDCHGKAFDAQAIAGWNGPGPFKIVNNTLIGSGENVMFGGADPAIANLIPSDIEFRRNYVYTPPAYKNVWLKKNLFETKNVRRLQIDGNVFDGSWADGQVGYAIVFKSANQAGRCTWCASSDISFTNNIIQNSGAGINLAGREGSSPHPVGARLNRVLVQNNSIQNIATGVFTGDARLVQVLDDVSDLTIRRNTMDSPGKVQHFLMLGPSPASTRFSFDNNITVRGAYGLFGTSLGEGAAALGAVNGWTFNSNVIVNSVPKSNYPATTQWATTMTAARAIPGAGADMSAITAATSGIIIP